MFIFYRKESEKVQGRDCIMSTMLKKVFHYLKSRPGLCILILILSVITITNLKPEFYLLGWDNYSSYFNLKTNIFRTFFATWRQYRGLGVPSDSESTDLFRQLFYLLISPFVKTQLLDQLYILFSLNLGVYLMYFFVRTIFWSDIKENHQAADLIGFISAFFYLFNLNTLSTFYFPMIMFVNRFYTVPLILLLLLRIIQKRKEQSHKDYIALAIASVLTSGSYMTATVFITFVIVLFFFFLFAGRSVKNSLFLFSFFIALNSFWLFPFANYTIQRSGIVYSAPTFIEANEIQLNKPASFYSWDKQLILYPNFFDTPLSNISKTLQTGYHPIIAELNNPATRLFIFLFPLLFILGSLAIIIRPRKNKRLLWIPTTLFLYLFLSFKAFSPLGFIYVFFEKHLPFFANLFRFGDTKFHFFIAFAGSLSVGYLFCMLIQKISKKTISVIILVILLCGLFTYRDYLSGHLFGFFMRNKIPDAYFQIAQKINADKSEGRVLHLPYDDNGYWRSYSWGYLGSSFLNFMIDHPLVEKTFEPASGENARLNSTIFDAIANSQTTDHLGTYPEKTTDFYNLLKKTGVKYIVLDGTVTSEQAVKGLHLWGRFNTVDSQSMISHLKQMGYIQPVASYPVLVGDYLDSYEKIFPLSKEEIARIKSEPPEEIALYEVRASDPEVRMSGSYSNVDSKFDSFNTDPYSDVVQKPGFVGNITPFQRKDVAYSFLDSIAHLTVENTSLQEGKTYAISLPTVSSYEEEQSYLIVFARIEKEHLIFSLYNKPTPDIKVQGKMEQNLVLLKTITVPLSLVSSGLAESKSTREYLSNWQALPYSAISSLRIQIGDTILPVPPIAGGQDQLVGSLIRPVGNNSFAVLMPQNTYNLQGPSLHFTDKPNCFADKLTGYSYAQNNDRSGSTTISSINGSTCFLSHLPSLDVTKNGYIELHFSYVATQKDLDGYDDIQTSKPLTKQTIASFNKPNVLSVCLKDASAPACYNTHQVLNLTASGEVMIPTEKKLGALDPIVFFALKNSGRQSQSITIRDVNITPYTAVLQSMFTIPSNAGRTYYVKAQGSGSLTLQFEQPMNTSSYYQGPNDGYYLSNGLCTTSGSYRTFRQIADTALSYFVNCDTNFSVPLEFDSNSFMVWSVDYHLASGKYPRFVLSDGFITYASEYLSLHQGYPSIPGFFSLQNPELPFAQKSVISGSLTSASFAHASIVVPPHPEYKDGSQKNFEIAQDSENEGIALYKNMNVMNLPNTWYGLSLAPVDAEIQNNDTDVHVSSKNILPSLWKATLSPKGKGLIIFNEAYDAQWGIYKNMTDLLIGKAIDASHYECNGFANCFDLKGQYGSFYIFYSPEKLNLLGWVATFLVAIFVLWRVKKP